MLILYNLILVTVPCLLPVMGSSHESGFHQDEFPTPYWESQIFALPANLDWVSVSCAQLNVRFCLIKLAMKQVHPRLPQVTDRIQLLSKMEFKWHQFNWFSFDPRSFGTCCDTQIDLYIEFGQRYGISPSLYFKKITDFCTHKHLNFIQAVYNPRVCRNIITMVGFGNGVLDIQGGEPGYDYLLPLEDGTYKFVQFPSQSIVWHLTFDWFKENVVCKDQPWICQRHVEFKRRRLSFVQKMDNSSLCIK